MQKILLVFALSFLVGCGGLKNSPTLHLTNHYYEFKTGSAPYRKVYGHYKDSLSLFELDKQRIKLPSEVFHLRNRTFDVDIMTVPFKYRPSSMGFPRQMNAAFNGQVYSGYRIDKFKISKVSTPGGLEKVVQHYGLSAGFFGGLSSVFVSPWTTNYRINDEYDGLALTRGVAVMAGWNGLTVGLGVGWDSLTDRDKQVWIYQNKPWYGVTIGLNLN